LVQHQHLCNIACGNCYIQNSLTNDALVYIAPYEVATFLGQIEDRGWPIREIGFTGGEPFMNPGIITMTRISLERGYDVLILTDAMQPMMRPNMRARLLALKAPHPEQLKLRVFLDHYTALHHDQERGDGSYVKTRDGMRLLRDHGVRMAVAGHMM